MVLVAERVGVIGASLPEDQASASVVNTRAQNTSPDQGRSGFADPGAFAGIIFGRLGNKSLALRISLPMSRFENDA